VTGSASPSVYSHLVLHLGTSAVPQGTHHHADLDEVLEVATGVTLELPRRSASSLADHTPAGLPQLGDRLVQPFGGQALRKAGSAAVGEVMSSRTRSTAGPAHSDLCRSLTFMSYATSA
jgi:hypothetical protein